ncbi:MAG: DUF3300 domain-containing protein [Enterobacterales bacterium]|nr:DUF3300 domain-containing protein [Enterobacterales bacterium]
MKLLKSIFLFGLLALTIGSTWADDDDRESDDKYFSQAELEQILAPIALYPDTILSHVLIAATYPLEVIQAERWAANNPNIKGSDAVRAVEYKSWDPSIKALTAFPKVLKRMSENLEWTQKLGDAFLQNEKAVLASVQSLRQKAYDAGNLDKMDKVSISRDDNNIVIQPVEREIVYVPYYDTRVVYGPWYWSHYPPVYWYDPYYDSYSYSRYNNPFYWGPSIHISYGFFFSAFHWQNHQIMRIPHHYYRPGHYYSHQDIVYNQNTRRWSHNPAHRRGVSYRSVTVSNRYQSNRLSRAEILQNRNVRYADGRAERSNSGRNTGSIANRRGANRNTERANRTSNNGRANRNTRIATPERIREELKDGRISVKERKARPRTKPTTRNRNTHNREDRSRESQSRSNENSRGNETHRGTRSRSNETRNRSSGTRQPSVERKPAESRPVERSSSTSALRRASGSRSSERSSGSSNHRSSRSDSSRSRSSSNRSSSNRSSNRGSRSSHRGERR